MGGRGERKLKLESRQRKIREVIGQFESSGISVKDFEKVNTLLENISKIISGVEISLPLLCQNSSPVDLENSEGQSSPSESEKKEESWMGQLRRLRMTAISLLSGRSIEGIQTKENHGNKGKKRKWEEYGSAKTKICKIDFGNESESENGDNGSPLFAHCYICKAPTPAREGHRHSFYPWMCPPCGDLNYHKRTQSGDLDGKLALVTGGRIKIGYEIVLKLLRAGSRVVVTTRFPNDARKRFQKELDFPTFAPRLHFYGLDLRFLHHVEEFCESFIKMFGKLDILIQNAAQTIRKPTVYYQKLIEGERQNTRNFINATEGGSKDDGKGVCAGEAKSHAMPLSLLGPETKENGISLPHSHSAQLLVHPDDFKYKNDPVLREQHFPNGESDSDGNQLDLRSTNSWILKLDQVETSEMVEVTLVNYMAPYLILQKLTPLMKRQGKRPTDLGFIILVSAMEGKFENCLKSGKHPHTNGAKAGLNMLVRTCAKDYYKELGVVMNAVDTGWVTEEHPIGYNTRTILKYPTPLDSIDGASRVLDPIFTTIANQGQSPVYGKFIKDYQPTNW